MMLHLVLAAALNLVPVHGVVLDRLSTGSAIVRTDDVPLMLPASVRRYRITPASAPAGTQIDALLDRSTTPWTLREATAAGEFSPGLPEPGRVIALELGSPLPRARLVDQNGRIVDLGRAFAGKTTLIAFI
ncbi:MAG: hypothetical protein JOZ01_02030, partial [Candidatus Eremiobacteraeota bacterium]|nr:hypothetical protein [Candidatus Eremiobacteraeota bacterium]